MMCIKSCICKYGLLLFSYVSNRLRVVSHSTQSASFTATADPSQSIQTPRKLSCKEKPISEAVLPAFSGGPSCPAAATEVVVLRRIARIHLLVLCEAAVTTGSAAHGTY